MSVNTGTDCTGDISDNIECLDKDGDGQVDMDYIFDVFMGSTNQSGFQKFGGIMSSVTVFIDMFETVIDIASIQELFGTGLWFDSGLYTGKGLLNMVFVGIDLVKVVIDEDFKLLPSNPTGEKASTESATSI